MEISRDALLSILKNDAELKLERALFQALDAAEEKDDALKAEFLLLLSNLCCQILELKEKKTYTVKYLQFIPLRNRILNKNYRYEIRVYDEFWQFYDGIKLGEYDVSFLYQYLNEPWECLLQQKKPYLALACNEDIRNLISEYLKTFQSSLAVLLKKWIRDAKEQQDFPILNGKNDLHIWVGELYEYSFSIYEGRG